MAYASIRDLRSPSGSRYRALSVRDRIVRHAENKQLEEQLDTIYKKLVKVLG